MKMRIGRGMGIKKKVSHSVGMPVVRLSRAEPRLLGVSFFTIRKPCYFPFVDVWIL